jgi:hypothetical protein
MSLDYGKKSTHESYHNGELKSIKTEYSIPVVVTSKPEVLTQLMDCVDLITTKQTDTVSVTIKADPKTHEIRLITRSYITEKSSS